MKKILMLNGSFCETPIIKELKNQGYYVITTGNAPGLEGHQFADEYIYADYSDKEKILQIMKDNKIDQIITCANDFGVLTTAYVAERLGIPGHDTYKNAFLIHHKDEFRRYCKQKNLPSPKFEIFESADEAKRYCGTVDFPVMIKANDLTGGKGINKANYIADAYSFIDMAFEKSRDKKVIIEDYIAGKQYSFWGFICNGFVIATSSNDCYSLHNPYLIQAEIYPSDDVEQKYKDELIEIVNFISRDLNLTDGIICVQFMVQNENVYIIETMRRCFGNDALSVAEKATGFPWVKGFIKASLGEDCSSLIERRDGRYYGHFGIMPPHNGKVISYSIPEAITNHVYRVLEANGPGDEITDYLNQRIAYLFYEYPNHKSAENAVIDMYNNIIIEMEH